MSMYLKNLLNSMLRRQDVIGTEVRPTKYQQESCTHNGLFFMANIVLTMSKLNLEIHILSFHVTRTRFDRMVKCNDFSCGFLKREVGQQSSSYFTQSFSRHHWTPGRATQSNNKKQGKGAKQILIGLRAMGRNRNGGEMEIRSLLVSTLDIFQRRIGKLFHNGLLRSPLKFEENFFNSKCSIRLSHFQANLIS